MYLLYASPEYTHSGGSSAWCWTTNKKWWIPVNIHVPLTLPSTIISSRALIPRQPGARVQSSHVASSRGWSNRENRHILEDSKYFRKPWRQQGTMHLPEDTIPMCAYMSIVLENHPQIEGKHPLREERRYNRFAKFLCVSWNPEPRKLRVDWYHHHRGDITISLEDPELGRTMTGRAQRLFTLRKTDLQRYKSKSLASKQVSWWQRVQNLSPHFGSKTKDGQTHFVPSTGALSLSVTHQ